MALVYDAGALAAAERRSAPAWTLHREALQSGITPALPAAVLAQVWRGRANQANLARLPGDRRAHAVGLALVIHQL